MQSNESSQVKLDAVGKWSEVKLEIVRKYAQAYTTILTKSTFPLVPVYIDGFAGAGEHESRRSGLIIDGSPKQALATSPPFSSFHFVDIDPDRVAALKAMTADRPEAKVWEGDCNEILSQRVFPQVLSSSKTRALCFLDPYGVHLDWDLFEKAGQSGHIEIFLNFAVLDMQRNFFRKNSEKVSEKELNRMRRFWGDDSWKEIVYSQQPGLFEVMETKEKGAADAIAQAFRKRLKDKAGFGYVPDPVPMRNSRGNLLFYLFFAAPETRGGRLGEKIVNDIFNKYRKEGVL
jgi:three-Cys-motif partner protein